MSQKYVPGFYKVLYSSYGWIFDELEMDNPGYYAMNRSKQWELLKAKVETMIPQTVEPMMNIETVEEPEEPETETETEGETE